MEKKVSAVAAGDRSCRPRRIHPDPGPAGHPYLPGNCDPRDGSDKGHHRSLPPQPTP